MTASTPVFRVLAVLAACAALPGAVPATAAATPSAAESPDSAASPLAGWSRLVLEGREWLVAKGRSEIRRRAAGGESGPEQVAVVTDAWVFGAHVGEHRALSVFVPCGARTAYWQGWVPGEKLRRGTVGEGTLGVVDYRFREEQGGWVEHRSREIDLEPAKGPEGPWDVYALLARLGPPARAARGGEPVRVAMLTKERVVLGRLRHVRDVVYERRVENLDTGEKRRMSIPCVELELEPAAENADAEHMLDMRGPVRMLVDPVSGALVEIEGTHAGLDRTIRLRLDAFATAPPELPVPPEVDGGAGSP